MITVSIAIEHLEMRLGDLRELIEATKQENGAATARIGIDEYGNAVTLSIYTGSSQIQPDA